MELHIAMGFGTEEDIQRLIDEGVDVNVPDARGWYPLHRAVEKNNFNRSQLFLKSGGKLESKLAPNHCMGYNSECTALFIAVQNSNPDLVKLLLDSGADVNSADSNGWRPIHTLLVPSTFYQTFGLNVPNVKRDFSSVDIDIFKLLVKHGADLNIATTGAFRGFCTGTMAMQMAAKCGNSTAIEQLLLHNSIADKPDSEGKTAMSFAEECGNPTCVNLLLGVGCNGDVQTESNIVQTTT